MGNLMSTKNRTFGEQQPRNIRFPNQNDWTNSQYRSWAKRVREFLSLGQLAVGD